MRNLRILITTALMIASSSLGVSAASAADRVATNCTSASRAQAPATRAAAAPVTVWLAGDSTMANPSSGRCPVGWGSQFDALFNSDVTVKNQAVGGRSIQTWLYEGNVSGTKGSDGECRLTSSTYSSRWQAMLNASTGMKAGDYLFIQFGINDSSSTCPRHVGPVRYQQLMTMMAQAALARGAHPVLLTPVAAITCSGSTATKNRGFEGETFAVASATGARHRPADAQCLALQQSALLPEQRRLRRQRAPGHLLLQRPHPLRHLRRPAGRTARRR